MLVDVQTAGNAIGKVAAAARNLTSRLLLVALVQNENANTYELASMGYNVVVATEELGSLLAPLVNEALAILHPKPALITPLPMEQSQPAGAFCGLRVFVADDSTPHLEYCRHLLEAAGADVHVTSSGDDAFKSLVENIGAYDLALLDYFLPACTADKILAKLRLAESAGGRAIKCR